MEEMLVWIYKKWQSSVAMEFLITDQFIALTTGSYTASSGTPYVRQRIAEFITRRDAGVPSYPLNIFICAGFQMALMV